MKISLKISIPTWFSRLSGVAFALGAMACTRTGELLRPADDTVVLMQTVARLSTGQGHACAVSAGKMSCWGQDGQGRLGVSAVDGEGLDPVMVPGGPWLAPAAGESHSCGLTPDGAVYCWGSNDSKQLGAGDQASGPTAHKVALSAAAVDLRTSFGHTCALLADATLWCWGANREGQLGQNDPFPGADAPTPLQVGEERDWMAISPGQGHSCGLRAPGALYCWGRNTGGELGQGTKEPQQIRRPTRVGTDEDWVEIASGQATNCARKRNGTLWCWGSMNSGALGVGDTAARLVPTQVPTGADWTQAAAGTFHTCGLREGGHIFCAGRNVEGQLGMPALPESTPSPTLQAADPEGGWLEVRTGRFFTCARKANDTVYCLGVNRGHELGMDPALDISTTMVRVPWPW